MNDLKSTLDVSESRCRELKAELEANKINESDPWYKEYSTYVTLINDVLGKIEKAIKDHTSINAKLGALTKELGSNKEKVVTK